MVDEEAMRTKESANSAKKWAFQISRKLWWKFSPSVDIVG